MSKQIAILIANSKFLDKTLPSLCGVEKDNQDLALLLSNPELSNFEVKALLDSDFLTVRKTIASTCNLLDKDDTFLLYYSGPSFLDKEGNFCLPVYDSDSNIWGATSIEPYFILSEFRKSRSKRFVLIIDGCYSGAFFRNNQGIPDGLIAITSCSSIEASYETSEGGVFTQALIKGLKSGEADINNDGEISVDELYEYVRIYLAKTDHNTHPQKWVWNIPEPIIILKTQTPIFISYSRKDLNFVESLSKELEKRNVKVWMYFKGINSGEDWLKEIASALEKAKAVLFIMSESSLKSKWVRRELEFADQQGLPIIPVEYKKCNIPSWYELQFGRIQRNKIDGDVLHENIDTLIGSIRTKIKI